LTTVPATATAITFVAVVAAAIFAAMAANRGPGGRASGNGGDSGSGRYGGSGRQSLPAKSGGGPFHCLKQRISHGYRQFNATAILAQQACKKRNRRNSVQGACRPYSVFPCLLLSWCGNKKGGSSPSPRKYPMLCDFRHTHFFKIIEKHAEPFVLGQFVYHFIDQLFRLGRIERAPQAYKPGFLR
jgi:hypothetical protein